MEFWIKASQLILSLSILIFLHELGHFLPARWFKIRVEKFYLFFNPWFSLVKKKIGDTEWGIGWIPLGGYVKIAGMVDESMDKEQLAAPPKPDEFRSKPAWQRLIVMIGGVTVNIIVGIVIYILVMFGYGEQELHTKDLQNGLSIHPYMQKYDLQSGDNILEINGEKVKNYKDINRAIMIRDQYDLKVQKADGTIKDISLPENIEYELFKKEGAMAPFNLRNKSNTVVDLYVHRSLVFNDKLEIKKGSTILKVGGKSIASLKPGTHSSEYAEKKSVNVQYVDSEGDTITGKIKGTQVKKLFAAMPAFVSNLRPGDVFLAMNGKKINYYDEVTTNAYNGIGKRVPTLVLRGTDTVSLNLKVNKSGMLGFKIKSEQSADTMHIREIKYGFGESISRGFSMGMTTLGDYVGQLKFLFTKKGASSVGGFGAIGNLFSPTWDWHSFWMNTALISIILAFMNILPIPALDGGHVVFLLYEIITGKEAPQKVLEYAQTIGFFLLIALLLYANGNDIYRAFFG
ncbi:MAG: site-2 protease family protein [Crocinitomicaceae bacterium]|nr:site-2 protease family protein [Crocinitomicaceae bacterium]